MLDEVDLEKAPECRNYYRFLHHLVAWRKPQVALEIGVEFGLASIYMAMAAEQYDGWVIGLDINKVSRKHSNYYFIQGDSTNITTWNKVFSFCEEYGKIGVVYQDSSHHYKASQMEWNLYSKLLDKNTIWICDDITKDFWDKNVDPPGCGMIKYFDERPGDKRLYPEILHHGSTQGIILLNRE